MRLNAPHILLSSAILIGKCSPNCFARSPRCMSIALLICDPHCNADCRIRNQANAQTVTAAGNIAKQGVSPNQIAKDTYSKVSNPLTGQRFTEKSSLPGL